MAEPAYMRIRHRKEFIPGPITECGEDNLWQIHEFAHEISGFPLLNPSPLSHWDTKHKVVKVVLEIGAFLPRLYGVRVDQGEYINRSRFSGGNALKNRRSIISISSTRFILSRLHR